MTYILKRMEYMCVTVCVEDMGHEGLDNQMVMDVAVSMYACFDNSN